MEQLNSPQVPCEAVTAEGSDDLQYGCGLERGHGGPHFSSSLEVFWMTPGEAIVVKEAVWRWLPEVWSRVREGV